MVLCVSASLRFKSLVLLGGFLVFLVSWWFRLVSLVSWWFRLVSLVSWWFCLVSLVSWWFGLVSFVSCWFRLVSLVSWWFRLVSGGFVSFPWRLRGSLGYSFRPMAKCRLLGYNRGNTMQPGSAACTAG